MSTSTLEALCRTNHFRYEVLSSNLLCLKTSSEHGSVHGFFIRELRGEWVEGAAEFLLLERNIPTPEALCAHVIRYTHGAVSAAYEEQCRTIYLRGNFKKSRFETDIDIFADFCEDFGAMLSRIEEIGSWDEHLFKLMVGGSNVVH